MRYLFLLLTNRWHYIVFALIIAVGVLGFGESVKAQPVISSVSGNLIDGNNITITGEGFGKKAIAGPIRFDQFEDNVSDGDRLNTGGFWELEEHTDAMYNASNQRTTLSRYNVRNKLVYGGDNGPFGKDVFNSKVGRKFISFWCYIGNVDVHPTDHWQLKLWRVLSGPDHGSYPTIAFQAWFNPNLTTYAHYYQTTGTDLGSIWGFSLPLNRWFYMQLEIQDSSGISVPDGTIIATALYGNGERYKVVKTGVKTRTSDYPDVFTWVKFGYFMTSNVSQGDTVTTYWDDIYIDYSWARVELGNAPSYDNCSHRETQKILTWNDDGSIISIEVNQGSFKEGDTAYLFVVDADGNVSNGYPITVQSGSDTTPPVRTNPQPTGTLSSGTTQTTISLTTDETATCKYSTTAGTDYDSMGNTFSSTNSTTHSQIITGLSDGGTYTYYIRCRDEQGNTNTDDYPITFSVARTSLQGDVTGDNIVDINDVQACVNHILGRQNLGSAADVNGDEEVTVLDVQEVVNIVLG